MSEDRSETDQYWGYFAFLIILLPVLYALSFGPMHVIYYETGNPVFDLFYETVYLPLDWLYEETSLLDGFIDFWEALL